MDVTPFCVQQHIGSVVQLKVQTTISFYVFIEDSFQNNYDFFIVLYDCIV